MEKEYIARYIKFTVNIGKPKCKVILVQSEQSEQSYTLHGVPGFFVKICLEQLCCPPYSSRHSAK